MKINVKLLLLTITIITVVSVSSAFIYNTLTKKLLLNQQSKTLINSANDFIFAFQEFINGIDEEFNNKYKSWNNFDIDNSNLDFVFMLKNDSSLQKIKVNKKRNTEIYTNVISLSRLIELNTNLIIRKTKINNNNIVYYGKILTPNITEKLSEKIRAEIAFTESGVISQFTHRNENSNYLPNLSKAARELKSRNNFELVNQELESADFFATHFTPKSADILNPNLDFIIFSISKEASEFRGTMNLVTFLIVIAGIFLTIIFSFLFTTKFRKQLYFINEGLKSIASGNLSNRVKIISKDEIGNLGNAFNEMLDEIEKKDKIEKEYSEFISLINQNPSLKEISEVAIEKIINYTGADLGALYLYEEELIPLSVYGISEEKQNFLGRQSLYKRVKDTKEIVELNFETNLPVIKTGLIELKISCLYILPLIYNEEVIAIVELASVNENGKIIKEYYERIKKQLAIGLANAVSLNKLEKLVNELKHLNEVYQKQNIQITEQNEELLELHKKLKKGSEELEIQKEKAIESAKLKSQFLANMSHELRTPQNSILGLTELILKDKTISAKTKERLKVVLRNGKKLLNLIENILEFSKLEAGSIKVEKSEIKLSELAEEITLFVEPLFYERKVKFNLNLPVFNEYILNTDIKKVEQIIFNLVGNASKFTKEGYVQLAFEVKGNDLKIIVEDTGTGINESDKKIIFEEFRQADANINRKYSGTGLGLTICKRYTDLLNGSIKVGNSKNNGAEFTVYLPNVIKSKYEKKYIEKEKNIDPENINALLISKGTKSVKLIKDFLSNNKINVELFNENENIISAIKNGNFNLIIIDILYDNFGWNTLYQIKNEKTTSDIPVIALNMDEETNCGLTLQIMEYYKYPFDKPNIYRAIEEFENIQEIKFRNILLIMADDKYAEIKDDMIFDELKVNQINGKISTAKLVKKYEPDLIIIDLFNPEINTFLVLGELNNDKYTKDIPTVAFIDEINEEEEIIKLNGNLIEATLISQNHPLEALQIIKNRVELINNSLFDSDYNNRTFPKKESDMLTTKQRSEKIKILIVDDDNDALFTIGEIVETLGYEPVYASNGYECLEKLEKSIPDLVLLDIMMPQMDGFTAIKKIRNDSRFKNLTIFALTAYAMLSDKEIIERNGFDGLFTKPINTHLIEKKLKNIFAEA